MPSSISKRKAGKNKKTKSSTSTSISTASRASSCHPYLDGREQTAIESWNDTVPKTTTRPNDKPEEQDPVIKAYLEAKLNLFRTANTKSDRDNVGHDA